MINRIAGFAVMSLFLAACGSSEAPAPTAVAPKRNPSSAHSSVANQRVTAIAAEAGAPLSIEFELLNRPTLGESLEIKLYLLGMSDATDLQLAVSADKLQITDGAQAKFPALKAGETLEHTIKLASNVEGLMLADVQIHATVDGKPKSSAFSIPVAFVTPDAKPAAK